MMKPYRTGLLYQRLEAEVIIRRNSPHGKAGQKGGWVAARTYPAAQRPRGAGGRFTSNATPTVAEQTVNPGVPGRAKAQTTEPSGAGNVASDRNSRKEQPPSGMKSPVHRSAGIPASTPTTPGREV